MGSDCLRMSAKLRVVLESVATRCSAQGDHESMLSVIDLEHALGGKVDRDQQLVVYPTEALDDHQ